MESLDEQEEATTVCDSSWHEVVSGREINISEGGSNQMK